MINDFQAFLLKPENKRICIDVLKLFHPEWGQMVDDLLNQLVSQQAIGLDKIVIETKYDWICIHHEIINAHIGISFDLRKDGPIKGIDDFNDIRMVSKFTAWRFFDDIMSVVGRTETIEVHDLLIENRVTKPTPVQMMEQYFEEIK